MDERQAVKLRPMSYLVLARKYRPRSFAEMVGQEHVVQALTNALTQQRLHHAYLFTGTRGVGKTTVSRILAKSLNCTGVDGMGSITASPCGQCPACREIDSGRFPDYTELDAASNRGVDEVQSLLEQAVYKPVQGRFKVFMIDEVHMLTNTAFNAMLKTLEEPPEYLKFVLATTDPQKVPVTVLSRCLQFNLRPMAPDTVVEHLAQVLQRENLSFEPQALRLLARGARGSMRDALSLTDQAIAFGGGQLQEAAVRQMLGSVDRSHVFRLIAALADADGRTIVETVETLRHHGVAAASTLQEMCTILQRMAVLQAVPSMAHASDSMDPDAPEIARLALVMPADETQLTYSIALHGQQELGLAPDEYAALTMTLLRPLAFKASHGNACDHDIGDEKKTAPLAQPQPLQPPAQTSASEPEPVAAAAPPIVQTAPPATPGAQQTAILADTEMATGLQQTTVPSSPIPIGQDVPPWEPLPVNAIYLDTPESMPLEPAFREAEMQEVESSAPPMPASEHGDFWHATVTRLSEEQAITALVRELALQSELTARTVQGWTLRIERASLNQPVVCERLAKVLQPVGCPALTIEMGTVHDTPALRNKAYAQARQRRAEAIVHNDPQILDLIRTYGATLVPGSIRPV